MRRTRRNPRRVVASAAAGRTVAAGVTVRFMQQAPAPTVTNVKEAIARLQAIESALPASDGVACFARLYRRVTEGVNQALDTSAFSDPAYLARLDVVFANLFF